MKTLYCFLFLICISLSLGYSQERKSTKTENVTVLKKEFVFEKVNDISHKIWLYLPPDYSKSKKSYPVIYMHDAQNLFDDKTSFVGEWKIDETLNSIYSKTGKGFIVVGIEHGGKERISEYTPWKNERYGGGKGKEYVEFLVKTLKPYIDKNYRTLKDKKSTAIIGSSLGGLISYYAGLEYPETFGLVGALSTSFWFSDQVYEFSKEKGSLDEQRLFLLVGEKEGSTMVPDMKKAKTILLSSGFKKENIKSKVTQGAKHNEAFWSSEFEAVIHWLFKL